MSVCKESSLGRGGWKCHGRPGQWDGSGVKVLAAKADLSSVAVTY